MLYSPLELCGDELTFDVELDSVALPIGSIRALTEVGIILLVDCSLEGR